MKLTEFRKIITTPTDTAYNFKYSFGEFRVNNPNEEYFIYFDNATWEYQNPEELNDFWDDKIFNGKSIIEIIGEVEYLGEG
jgi:radical SAM superfamily enzyme